MLSNLAINNTIWFTSRCFSNIFWVIPLIIIFWPELKHKKPKFIIPKNGQAFANKKSKVDPTNLNDYDLSVYI